MDRASSSSRVEACRQLRWELTWQLRWEIARTSALASQSRASVALARSQVAQSRSHLRDSYQLLHKVGYGLLHKREQIEREYAHAELSESMVSLAEQPTPANAALQESMMSLAAQPAPECVVLNESMTPLVSESMPEDAEARDTLMALAAQLTPEDRAKFARFIGLLISARGDELAHRALRRVTDLEEMIAILKRHLEAASRR